MIQLEPAKSIKRVSVITKSNKTKFYCMLWNCWNSVSVLTLL